MDTTQKENFCCFFEEAFKKDKWKSIGLEEKSLMDKILTID
jgi:hypothetical protein